MEGSGLHHPVQLPRKCFRISFVSASTAEISSSEYCLFTTQLPSFGNDIFYSRSEEEPVIRLGVASTPVLSVLLGAGSDELVCRVAPAPGLVAPAVLAAVTLRPRRYSLALRFHRILNFTRDTFSRLPRLEKGVLSAKRVDKPLEL